MKKLLILLAVGAFFIPVLVFSEESVVIPPIPHLINYQGMLTDNSGNPLTGSFDITLKIYNDASAGTKRWEETQSGVTVTNGLFNVILGSVTPIDLLFDENYWLDITVGEEHMPSRLRLLSVGFAYRAWKADTASYASSVSGASHNHDATYVNVNGPDSTRGNYDGYMFRVKNYFTGGTWGGDGIYVYTPGLYGDGIFIDSAGDNGIEITGVKTNGVAIDNIHNDGLHLTDVDNNGIYMDDVGGDGINVNDAGGNGLTVNLADNGVYIDSTRTGNHGIYVMRGGNNGVYVARAGYHGVSVSDAAVDGFYLYHADNYGLYIEDSDDDGIRVASADSDGIEAYGAAGGGEIYCTDPTGFYYALKVHAYDDQSTKPGLHVYGYGSITGTWSTKLSGPSGGIPGYMVTSRDVEIIASGTGTLVNGKAEVIFDQQFQGAISPEVPIRVVVTAQDAPSALLYVTNKSNQGFVVKPLEIPELSLKTDNVSFDWIAIARQKGYEQRPPVVTSDEEKPTDWVSRWQEERKAEEIKHQQELQQDEHYRQQMLEKQSRREAERKENEKEREEQERGE